jgi:hypothetical protein
VSEDPNDGADDHGSAAGTEDDSSSGGGGLDFQNSGRRLGPSLVAVGDGLRDHDARTTQSFDYDDPKYLVMRISPNSLV